MRSLVTGMDRTPDSAGTALAVGRRRESARQEWTEHIRLAKLLNEYLDPSQTFWSSLENKPRTAKSGLFQKRRGVRSGLPDVLVMYRGTGGTIVIFIELKSCRGRVSPVQKQVRAEMLLTGARWYMARSARAALTCLHREGVPFCKAWTPCALEPHEGPFSETRRLPAHPKVRAERREAKRRYRLRKELRAREAAKLAPERDDDAGDDIAA
jgi:hypothetical protein